MLCSSQNRFHNRCEDDVNGEYVRIMPIEGAEARMKARAALAGEEA
jgi:hypothetical protein